VRTVLLLFTLCMLGPCIGQQTKPSQPNGISFPTPSSPTIPQDALFALGQQSGRLDAMNERLRSIENDLKEVGKDVTRINTIGSILGLLVVVILGPLAVERLKQIFKWGGSSHAPNSPTTPQV
jgi:hypothetical protein